MLSSEGIGPQNTRTIKCLNTESFSRHFACFAGNTNQISTLSGCAQRPLRCRENLVLTTELAPPETLPQIRWMEGGAPRRRNGSATPVCGFAFLTLSPAHLLTLGVARIDLFAHANI